MGSRRVLRGLAATAAILGMGAIFLARPGAGALGMPSDRRSMWALRLFGVRELVLGLGLVRAAGSREPGQERLMADLVAAAQVGDMLVSGALLIRGDISRRAMAVVWLGAVPTLLATRAASSPRNRLDIQVGGKVQMLRSKWLGYLPALIGAIFPVFGFVRGGGDDSAPTASSSGEQIATYAYHHGLPNSAYYIELGAFLALMVFSVVLYSRLRAAEPRGAIAAKVVVAACVVSVAIKLGSFPAAYSLYSSPTQLDPSVARPLWVMGSFAFLVSMLVQALSLGAVAVSGLRFGGIPRWLAGIAGVIAVALVVGFILGGNFQVAPTLAWFLWLLVASVTLFVRAPRTVSDEQPASTGHLARTV